MMTVLFLALGLLLIGFGSAAIWRPRAVITFQQVHGPGLFADEDESFVDDMVAATPYVGAVLSWLGVAVIVYAFLG